MVILVRDSLGLAIIYQDVLQDIDKDMRAAASGPRLPGGGFLRRDNAGPGKRVDQALASEGTCPACAARDEVTMPALRTITDNVLTADFAPAYQSSDGLCLPHFRRTVALCADQASLDALVSKQSQVLNALVAELSEFIRKHDYRFRQEQILTEEDSWRRAMEMVVGGTLKT